MGCVQTTLARDKAKARNDEIDTQLERDRITALNEIKLLLIGAEESNMSTLLDQMKLVHHGGFNEQERDAYKEIIYSNTIQSMRDILEGMIQLDLTLSPRNDTSRATILSLPPKSTLTLEVTDSLCSLSSDPSVQQAVHRSQEFQLTDSARYYFGSIDRIISSSYLPSDQDILRSRNTRTTGIRETEFKVGELTYKICEMGGQKGTQRKWLNCFENVIAVIFCVNLSLSEYDLTEDSSVNPVQEALELFDVICNSQGFLKTPIILFLNNTELLASKLPLAPSGNTSQVGANDYDAACDYILHRFVSLNRNPSSKQIYAHFTNTTDTQQIKFVLSATQDILLQSHLRQRGLI